VHEISCINSVHQWRGASMAWCINAVVHEISCINSVHQ